MRIAFATTEFIKDGNLQDGGLANYLYKICLGLKKSGHEVVVFTPGVSNDLFVFHDVEVVTVSFSVNKLFKFFDKISRFKLQPLLFAIWSSYYLNKAIKKYHKSKKIDIIQYPNLGGLGLFKPRHVPSVLRASSYTELWNDEDEIDSGDLSYRQIVFLEKLAIRRFKYIFAPSKLISDYLSRKFNKKAITIRTPLPEFDERKFSSKLIKTIKEQTGGQDFFLYYGGIGAWKGIPELLNVLPAFLERNNFCFVFMGNPKGKKGNEMLSRIIELAEDKKAKVIYFPAQPHLELIPLIDAAHAVVLPSRIENLSNASIESMSRGKIVLGTDGASFEELITDGVNGFLFRKGDISQLLEKLNYIASFENTRKMEIGKSAKDTIEYMLAPDLVLNDHISYYQMITKK